LEDQGRYKKLVEKLNYLTITRPDIAYPVNVVRQFISAPQTSHWDVVVRILQYLKNTSRRELMYSDRNRNRIAGFSDEDWAGCPTDRRSTTRYVSLLEGILCHGKVKTSHYL